MVEFTELKNSQSEIFRFFSVEGRLLTSTNIVKYFTVNVGYVRRIYFFYLGAVLLVVNVPKSLMKFFQ